MRLFGLTITAGVLLSTSAMAQAWPDKPIELVHGFAAGGNADVAARLVAAPLSEIFGKPVVVNSKPGAGGNIATEYVVRRPPDGYSLVLLVGGHAVSAALYKKLNFHAVNDLTFTSLISVNPFVMVVRNESPIRDLPDLIRRSKAQPGSVTFGSAGIGTTQHLVGEMVAQQAGIKLVHVPYRGGTQALTDMMGGTVDMLVDTITVAREALEGGKIRVLGISSPQPWPSLASAPPIANTIPNFSAMSWIGIAGPANMPEPIVRRLTDAIHQVMVPAAIKAKFDNIGQQVRTSTPAEMRDFISAEVARWNSVVDRAGIERQ